MSGRVIEKYSYLSKDNLYSTLYLFKDSIRLHVGPEVYVYDLEGRPIFIYYNDSLYERGLSNEFVLKKWLSINPPKRLLKRIYEEDIKRKILEYSHKRVREAYKNISSKHVKEYLDKILYHNYDILKEESKIFYKIYKPISILPPDQYLSLVLQPVEGCPYNRCSFCTFYRDRRFRFKDVDEFEDHVRDVVSFIGDGIKIRNRVFLADANALFTPMSLLKEYLRIINKYIPLSSFDGLYSFIDYFTVKKDLEDFIWLRNNGLKMVYIGLETGNNELLKILNKPGPPEKAIELVKILKKAGINVGVIILIGAGGEEYYKKHVRDTAKVLNEMPLNNRDIIYFSKLKIYPESEYYKISREHGFKELTDDLMNKQMMEIRKRLRYKEYPITAIYDIDEFVY